MDSLAKADDALRDALQKGDDVLRVVLTLERMPQGPHSAEKAHYASRQAMRAALIKQQSERSAAANEGALATLRSLGLAVAGGALTSVVVVTGSPQQIRDALASGAVRHAALDRRLAT